MSNQLTIIYIEHGVHVQLSHLHLDKKKKVRKFSKDQKVFKKQIANLGLWSMEGYRCFERVFFKPYG